MPASPAAAAPPSPRRPRPLSEPSLPPAAQSSGKKRRPKRSNIRPDGEKRPPTALGNFFSLIRIIFYAALIAAIVQIVRAPDPFPDFPPMSPEVSQSMRDRLTDTSNGSSGKRIEYPWSLINGYIAERVPPTVADEANRVRVEFIRAVLEPGTDSVHLRMERRVNDHPLFIDLEMRPVSRGNGGTSVRVVGGTLGRLPLPAFLASLLQTTAKPVTERLFYELEILAEAQVITLTPESAAVVFP